MATENLQRTQEAKTYVYKCVRVQVYTFVCVCVCLRRVGSLGPEQRWFSVLITEKGLFRISSLRSEVLKLC